MPKVKNTALAGQTLNVAGKVIALDAEGVADVTVEQAEILAQLDGYEVVAPAPAVEAPVTEAPVVEAPKAETSTEDESDKPKKGGKKAAASSKE